LEDKATALFASTEGPVFVLQSSMNVDRIVTMARAAKKTNRIILQDLYMAEVASAAGSSIPNPRTFHDVKVFLTRPYPREHKRYQLFCTYGASRIGRAQIAGERFVLFVRTSMLAWLRLLSKQMSFANGLLVYSLWNGYRENEDMKAFLEACQGLGLTVVPLHTSGHADAETIEALIRQVKPRRILPVHTENAPWFDGKGIPFDDTGNGGNHV
jgi:ribonuclease J